ncbi:MAG TPA: TIGR04086 family membrane protein [Bryobacteraceae bacterium]|jgi:putative membrane protein (TIGR04086 family)
MKTIRWGWVLLGGFVAELIVFAIVIPIAIFAGQDSLLYAAAPASLIATFVCGWWVAKKATHRPLLHGLLVGAAAVVIYVAMSLARPEPLAYIIAHALKLVGGVAGGYVSWRRQQGRQAPVIQSRNLRQTQE